MTKLRPVSAPPCSNVDLLKRFPRMGTVTRKTLSSAVGRDALEMFNPAQTLDDRLGFLRLRQFGVYHFMESPPQSSA